jgi:hypothetical protein
MSRRMFAQTRMGKPPKMPRAEARMAFGNIKHKLDIAHYLQGPQGYTYGAKENLRQRKVGGVSVTVFRKNMGDNPQDASQAIYINDPSQKSNSRTDMAPWGSYRDEVTYTKQFVRLLPEGSVKRKRIFSEVMRGAGRALAWVTAGAIFGIAMFYADRHIPAMGGAIAKVFEETASMGVVMGAEQIAAGIGAVGGAAISLLSSIPNLIWKSQYSFRGRMMEFIRDPANKDAVKALEDM